MTVFTCYSALNLLLFPHMSISTSNLSPLASLVFGILILVFPRFLNYLIAVYLILIGLIGLGILVL